MGDYRDDLAAAQARADALQKELDAERETDPELAPLKTPAELDAESGIRGKLDDADARAPWFGWLMVAVGSLLAAGALVRACWAS